MKILAFIRQRSFARYVAFDLAEAARRLGWGVEWVDLDAERQRVHALPEADRGPAIARVRQHIASVAPDLVFSYGLEAFAPVFSDIASASRWCVADEAGAPVACFLFDFGFPFDVADDPAVAPLLDRLRAPDVGLWCWDAAAIDDLVRLGIRAAPFPMAVNEQIFLPPPESAPARDLPIVFSGGPTGERLAALERLAPLGVSIYGYDAAAWQASPSLHEAHRGMIVERRALCAVYQRARLTVNVTRAHGRASLNMRVFEAMACGCLVLTDQAEAARALFDVDAELATYTSLDDLEARARHYLTHEADRRRIAAAGVRAVRERHTYVHRLESVTDALRTLMVEGRAWRHYQRYLADDPAKAARFVEALRRDGISLRL
jgi:hypothetical protein